MMCPSCSDDETIVIDTRGATGYIRRRRHCTACDERFTTVELVVDTVAGLIRVPLFKIKPNGAVICSDEEPPP